MKNHKNAANDGRRFQELMETIHAAYGQPRDVDAFHSSDGWKIVTAGRLKKNVAEALRRWVSIMAASQGGRALYTDERIAV